MFEGVTADEVTRRIDRRIGELEQLGERVQTDSDDEVRRPRVPRREEPHHQGNGEQREELHEQVEPQVAMPRPLALLPEDHAGGAQDQQRSEHPGAGPGVDALADDDR